MTEWKVVVGYENYRVSNTGEVFSANLDKMRKISVSRDGYSRLSLYKNGSPKTFLVHNLVAEAFLGPRPEGMQVNHKDGNKVNNHIGNLEYCTAKQNIQHAWHMGLTKPARVKRTALRKISDEEVLALREFQGYVSAAVASTIFGIGRRQVGRIWNSQRRKITTPTIEATNQGA